MSMTHSSTPLLDRAPLHPLQGIFFCKLSTPPSSSECDTQSRKRERDPVCAQSPLCVQPYVCAEILVVSTFRGKRGGSECPVGMPNIT